MIDVLVIGGGIAGVSVAARMSQFATVVLLEAEKDLAYHSSSRSAATYIENYGNSLVRTLNTASRDYLENNNGGVLSKRGMMLIGKSGQEDEFKKESASFGLTEINLQHAKEIFSSIDSSKQLKISFRPDVFDLDTDRFYQNFLKVLKDNAGKVYVNSRVIDIRYESETWTIRTKNQEFQAKLLINASGAWVDEIAIMANIRPLNFTPYRRSIARIKVENVSSTQSWPMIAGVNEEFYAKPDAGQLIVSPADETPTNPHDAWAIEEDLATGIFFLGEVSTISTRRISSSWAGLRTFAPDRALVIGPDPTNSNFFWFAGQGGYGFQTSAAASELASELILGKTPTIGIKAANTLSPNRFV